MDNLDQGDVGACVTSPVGRATPGTHARPHQTPRADPTGEVTQALSGAKWRATLRWRAASLTETVGRAPFKKHGRRAGEAAR
ncbi:DUF6380 family protein [Streptomyces sp. NL15-2K]|uniref:DUF6380 family protein n=1 Tax=Streptomyces sp. NL15-2K TaxID=376149 RepID=UPI000F55E630|nr:DUF6380 family protein [Streptomyces sp. NL15-2K]